MPEQLHRNREFHLSAEDRQRLLAYVRAHEVDSETAEDIVQEVMITGLEQAQRPDKATLRKLVDKLIQQAGHQSADQALNTQTAVATLDTAVEPIEDQPQGQALAELLPLLPEQNRRIITALIDGVLPDEVATAEGVSRSFPSSLRENLRLYLTAEDPALRNQTRDKLVAAEPGARSTTEEKDQRYVERAHPKVLDQVIKSLSVPEMIDDTVVEQALLTELQHWLRSAGNRGYTQKQCEFIDATLQNNGVMPTDGSRYRPYSNYSRSWGRAVQEVLSDQYRQQTEPIYSYIESLVQQSLSVDLERVRKGRKP